ncbi:MAG TPA: FecR domain-containing protein [Nannocystaceae bacterium]|nr:FecR domain-containing protein [Nannocystaceae bacterium]
MNASGTNLDDAARAWRVAGAPPGFADRVIAASEPESRAPVERSSRALVLAIAGVVAIAAALLLWTWSPRGAGGSLRATERATLELPMAVAVVEPGTDLEWNEVSGGAEVRQSSGRVFYRVEHGAVFDVVTPAARVTVRGTAFEVEVEDMHTKRKQIASGLAGVGIASAIVVTLYEGRVVVANDAGEVTLAPGEVARARAGEPPRVGERETVAALKAELAALRREVDGERQAPPSSPRLRDAAAEASAGDDERDEAVEAVHKCAFTMNGGPDCPNLQPSQAVLEHRADCGIVIYDRPSALESADVDFTELADLAELDDGELAKLESATKEFHAHVREQFEAIYRELGGDPELAGRLSVAALSTEIDELTTERAEQVETPEDERDNHYQRAADIVSAALAGRRPMPKLDELEPADRHAFLWTASGDMYEEWVARSLGAARAHELRAMHDGWTGNRGMQGRPHCPDAD